MMQGCPVSYTYTFEDVRGLLEGFEVLELKKDHIFPWKIDDYKQHRYVKEDYWKVRAYLNLISLSSEN
jgi:hypothetical protein